MTLDNITEIPQLQNEVGDHEEQGQFYTDVLDGLRSDPKMLPSKYFYDATGDRFFQEIMCCKDYYLTRCEMEVFKSKSVDMVGVINTAGTPFYLIELGPGDCTKSWHLLKALMDHGTDFTYVPVDISENVIRELRETLPEKLNWFENAATNR